MDRFHIEKLTATDIRNVNSIKPDEWPDISQIHDFYIHNIACNSIKVVNSRNEIVGIGTGISYQQTGWIAHIIVSKCYRNMGIGTLIVRNRIDYLQKERGCKTITLTATDLGYPVYKKIGFTEESKYILLCRANDYKIGSKSDNIICIKAAHYEEIFSIDKMISGENRKELITPLLKSGYAYIRNNQVAGYYFPRFGDGGISAINKEAGVDLLKLRITESNQIFIPEDNNLAYDFLIDNGYKEIKRIHRMKIGDKLNRNPQFIYSRIGGFTG